MASPGARLRAVPAAPDSVSRVATICTCSLQYKCMQRSPFRLGLIQMSCSPDPAENLAKAESRIRDAAAQGAQIVCVQELFRSQYFCREESAELFNLAESIPGPTSESFERLARELRIVIVGSVFERRTAGVYHNTAIIFD